MGGPLPSEGLTKRVYGIFLVRGLKRGVVATGCNVSLKSIYLLQQTLEFLVSWRIIRNSTRVKFDIIRRNEKLLVLFSEKLVSFKEGNLLSLVQA